MSANGGATPAPEADEKAEVIDIVTPAGGESVTEGTILEWAVAVGDEVADGQTVVEISTDKVDMELPAPTAGTITEILVSAGDTVTVGQVIARMQPGAGAATPADKAPTTEAARDRQRRRDRHVRRRAGLARRRPHRRRRGHRPRQDHRQRPGRPDHQGGRAGRQRRRVDGGPGRR